MEANLIEARRMNRSMRLLCIWSGLPMMILLFVGIVLAQIMPPQFPSDTATQVAEHYRNNTGAIRSGLALSFFGVIFFYAFGAAIAAQTRRMEAGPPVLASMQTAAFAAGSISFVAPWVFWEVAAFRPERADTEIALIHDLGWIFFTFGYVAFSAWLFAVGLAILTDVRPEPGYPRWFGYFNIFVAVSFIPDNLVVFFKEGPFAWSGIFPYWIPFIVYGIWILIILPLTVRAIKREAAEEEGGAMSDGDVRGASPVSPAGGATRPAKG